MTDSETSPLQLSRLRRGWNWFFFESVDPASCALLRILYGTLLLIMLLVQLPDLEVLYSSQGVLPLEASRHVVDPDTRTIFEWLPDSTSTVRWCYSIFLFQTLLLLAGFRPRFQAICLLMWLASFQHRNCLLIDGEDTVFRLFAFLLALSPCGCRWSVDNWLHRKQHGDVRSIPSSSAWALRLVQLQMTMIYVSTAWEKLNGEAWLDGSALYYASRLDDLFGRGPVPYVLFNNLTAMQWMTWTVLAVEVLLPVMLWFKETRRAAIVLGIGLHLSIEWMMNLFLFEWIMIAGLLTFATRQDLVWLKSVVPAWLRWPSAEHASAVPAEA